jgi:hypothetical protein
MLTEADRQFEAFCSQRGIPCHRIPEGPGRTPDFELDLAGLRVAVEVKQIEPNDEDLRFKADLESKGFATRWGDMGARVRQKISDAMKQLRPYAKGKMPALVLLYDAIEPHSPVLDPDAIRFALYGPERVHIAVPRDPSVPPTALGSSYGGDRAVDPNHNTTLSAVGALRVPAGPGNTHLQIFHNIYAALPLPTERLHFQDVTHYTLASDQPGHLPRWRQV